MFFSVGEVTCRGKMPFLCHFFAMFNLAELLSKTVPLPHIPSLWQTTPKVDK